MKQILNSEIINLYIHVEKSNITFQIKHVISSSSNLMEKKNH